MRRNRVNFMAYILTFIAILTILILPVMEVEGGEVSSMAYYKNKLYTIERQKYTLSVYCPENKSQFANGQSVNILVAIAWHGIPSNDDKIYIIGNNQVIAILSKEKMYEINITITPLNATRAFMLKFTYNNIETPLTLYYYANLTAPSIPFFTYLPLILQKPEKEKIKLEKEEVYTLLLEYEKEIIRMETLSIALFIAIITPFIARKIKNKIKFEDFNNPVNMTLAIVGITIIYIVVLAFSTDLYKGLDGLVPVFEHEIYQIVFLARLGVGILVWALFMGSYMVGWKLTELENVYPMLVVSPKLKYIELWLVVIYEAEIDGVMQTCIAPVNFGSAWRRLMGQHIVLDKKMYRLEMTDDGRVQLVVDDATDEPLESGFSFGKFFTKLYDNLILAEDIEFYDDKGEKLLILMEDMDEEELELRRKDYKEWLKKYGHKYRHIKGTKKIRILLADPHYNPIRVIYDADIVRSILGELKAYKTRYYTLKGIVAELVDGIVGKRLTDEILKVVPNNPVVGDTHTAIDQIVDTLTFNRPPPVPEQEEEISEEVKLALMKEGINPETQPPQ